MAQGLERYGLNENPYMVRPLDLLGRPEEESKLRVLVDRLADLKEAELSLRKAIDRREPAFFLIAGQRGTGRTSLANYILNRYRELRKIPKKRLIVPLDKVENSSEIAVLKSWMNSFTLKMRQQGVNLPGVGNVADLIKQVDADTFKSTYQDLVQRVGESLEELKGDAAIGFGMLLEKVRDYKVIDASFDILRGTPTVAIFTVENHDAAETDLISPFTNSGAEGIRQLVRLRQLRGVEARQLASGRWKCFSERAVPFDLDGVESAFNDRDRAIARILSLMERLIDWKTIVAGEGPEWPTAADLALSAKEIHAQVTTLERGYYV